MIDFLIAQIYPLTLLLSVVLILHKVALDKLGATPTYALWSIVPLALLVYNIPLELFNDAVVKQSAISYFITQPKTLLAKAYSVDWLHFVWVGVSLCIFMVALGSYVQFNNSLKLKKVPNNFQGVALPKGLIIYQSCHAHSPMLVGVFKQQLVIPEDFQEIYSKEQQQLILQHEICHYDRNDIYWNLVAFSFVTLFWFHPLVWLSYFRFRRDQELSCDQTVLARKQTESRITYSKALLVAAETTPPLSFAQLSFKEYGDKKVMFERLSHIKNSKHISIKSLVLTSVLSISMLSAVSVAGNLGGAEAGYNKENNTKLHPITRIEPKYPIQAAKEGVEGAVVLKFDINAKGDVENVIVLKSLPDGVFDNVATVALEQWKYEANNMRHNDLLVQLDFRMGPNSTLDTSNLLERIKVSH